MFNRWLTAERYDSRVGARFGTEDAARDAADVVKTRAHLPGDNVEVITPGDVRIDRKLEPELDAIARTMVRTHLIIGAAGLLLGMVFAGLLIWFEVQPFVSSAGLAFAVITALGAMLGLLFGGLAGFRPDHDPVIFAAKSAVESGAYYVVVRTREPQQQQAARRILSRRGTQLRTSM